MRSILEKIARPCSACGKTHEIEAGQFPSGVVERLTMTSGCDIDRDGCHEPRLMWTRELFKWMLEHPDAPPDYPGAWEAVAASINESPPAGPTLVVGSLSPWIECVAIRASLRESIVTTDPNPPVADHPRVWGATTRGAYSGMYCLIVSYSSIEHFGLGRYGDPIDPDADLKWMKMIRNCLAPGGRLVIGVPVGERDQVVECWHRIYGPTRLARLLEGWSIVKTIPAPKDVKHDWQNQPVMTLVPA